MFFIYIFHILFCTAPDTDFLFLAFHERKCSSLFVHQFGEFFILRRDTIEGIEHANNAFFSFTVFKQRHNTNILETDGRRDDIEVGVA